MCSPRQDLLSRMISLLEKAGFETGFTSIEWVYSTGFPKALNIEKAILKNNPNDNRAKELAGSYAGYQPKPSRELILVTMKKMTEKTFVAQALANGKGITHLDDARIPTKEFIEKGTMKEWNRYTNAGTGRYNFNDPRYKSDDKVKTHAHEKGRFASNLLVSGDVLDSGEITKSSGGKGEKSQTNILPRYDKKPDKHPKLYQPSNLGGLGDSGGFSRHFSLDAWWEAQIKHLPKSQQKTFPFLVVAKPSRTERNLGIEIKGIFNKDRYKGRFPNESVKNFMGNTDAQQEAGHNRFDTCANCGKYIFQNPNRPSKCQCENPVRQKNIVEGNFHPTVKSITLFCYLLSLGSRPNDIILDPYLGSGTTAIAAKILNRKWIGIEKKNAYITIANARIKEARALHKYLQSKLPEQPRSTNLFQEFGL
ncbi:MAG: site-specific DNA-methyltransferase [Thermodesulfobacteriota bacterium]